VFDELLDSGLGDCVEDVALVGEDLGGRRDLPAVDRVKLEEDVLVLQGGVERVGVLGEAAT
jgi:hypothetical protein